MLKDKYNMTREENILYAKRNIVDSIWKSANLEGIPVTFKYNIINLWKEMTAMNKDKILEIAKQNNGYITTLINE